MAMNAQCGNHRNLPSHFFNKNFVKATFLLKSDTDLFPRNIFSARVNFWLLYTIDCDTTYYDKEGQRLAQCEN